MKNIVNRIAILYLFKISSWDYKYLANVQIVSRYQQAMSFISFNKTMKWLETHPGLTV